jgi:DNA-damage-inducible protein D
MSAVARRAGVADSYDMGTFKNSGYLGMYNMTLKSLKTYKGLHDPKGSKTLYDYMSATELAANSFRVTQTAERIKRNQARGLDETSAIARGVGQQVRAMMMSDGGTAPENLELEQHISRDRTALKKTSRDMAQLDKAKRTKR